MIKTSDATEVKTSDAVSAVEAVNATVEAAAVKDGGLPQDGKRVRKLSQKGREFNQAMVRFLFYIHALNSLYSQM